MAKKTYTPDQQIDRLRVYNLVAGSLHLLQAIGFAIVLTMLSTQVLFAVTADYLAGPPGVPLPPERVTLFEVNIGIGVVAVLALSAFFHFLISSPWFFGRYKGGLLANRNYFRWTEYSLSSSIMIWLILAINGVTDIGALFAIFAVNAAMILFGALQEKYVLQHVRRQPVAAVQAGRQVEELPAGRAHLHHAEPRGEDGSCVAGVLRRHHPRHRELSRAPRSHA